MNDVERNEKFVNTIEKALFDKTNYENDYDFLKTVLNDDEITFYVVDVFVMEMASGGLESYLTNDWGVNAWRLTEELKKIGLDETAEYYESFIQENNIDLNQFKENDIDYDDLFDNYDWDEFDDEFYDDHIGLFMDAQERFVRAHPESFADSIPEN